MTFQMQKVQSNKADCATIAERTGQLMEAMIFSLRGKSDADIDSRLKKDLEKFGRYVLMLNS